MLGKDLSEALGGIAEDKIEAAANLAPVHRRPLWVRAAACAAVLALLIGAVFFRPGETKTEDGQIIEAPGILKVYAYDMNDTDVSQMTRYELAEDVASCPYEWTFAMNSLYGLPLTLCVEDEKWTDKELTLHVEVDYGGFYGDIHNDKYKKDKDNTVAKLSDVYFGDQFTIENGETIFWTPKAIYLTAAEEDMTPEYFLQKINNTIYANIIICCDENIVGYTVVKILHNDGWYSASVEDAVLFPLVNGQFQQVTEEYVRHSMNKE